MIPVDQTIINFKTGDCYRACIASMLELPISAVPNFMEDGKENFDPKFYRWLISFGIHAMDVTLEGGQTSFYKDVPMIAGGRSPRGSNLEHRHCVIYQNDALLHDPHPSREGLRGPPDIFTILFLSSVSQFVSSISEIRV